jgi:hypothetical protein
MTDCSGYGGCSSRSYAQRLEGRIERRIRESRLPERKTFEAFDFGQHR